MPLLNDVQAVCQRLAQHGWDELMARHGLNLHAADFAHELARSLPGIDRLGVPGFADFHADAVRAIEPGSPARSLLYHALASPAVHPIANGLPAASAQAYPTLDELDTIENYIYAQQQLAVADVDASTLRVVVFAYQYRNAPHTGHGLYADLCYSRTGVARVGTAAANYRPAQRSFWPVPTQQPGQGIAVMGARYGSFLAEARPLGPQQVLVGGRADMQDAQRRFWVPVHKLFEGSECLTGTSLQLQFGEFHLNEKLARIHRPDVVGHIPALLGFDLTKPPFVRSSKNGAPAFVQLTTVGGSGKGSVLVMPVPSAQLVTTAKQQQELARFVVPAAAAGNRFEFSSFQIEAPNSGRIGRFAPEYVNIRHEVTPTGQLNDLNQLPTQQYAAKLAAGGYEAAHFLDHSADGCVGVAVSGLDNGLRPPLAAYSLVTAPDFLPLIDQTTIFAWASSLEGGENSQFAQGSPNPLSHCRLAANPAILHPATQATAFDPSDTTMTAVLNRRELGPVTRQLLPPPALATAAVSYLPDAAANVFAPGWDVSQSFDPENNLRFLTSLGLGSPFPEDAKLCAALNSFWPAAAPDATRTFGKTAVYNLRLNRMVGPSTAQPMLDQELGYHPRHPLVRAGAVQSRRGWDGEFGPFLEEANGKQWVNYTSIERSDYVANALADLFHVDELSHISADEMITRMEAIRACIRHLPDVSNPALPPSGDLVSTTEQFLVQAEAVADWENELTRFDRRLQGPGYRYVFVEMTGPGQPDPQDERRLRRAIKNRFECQLVATARQIAMLAFDINGTIPQFIVGP